MKPQSEQMLLASAGEDGWVCLWHLGRQLTQALNGASNGFSCLSWHPTGQQLSAGGQNGEIVFWTETKRGKGFQA